MIYDEVAALSRTTDRPGLTALSYALRHPDTWPSDFVWHYDTCENCAIGLALRLWPSLQLPKGQNAQQAWIAREMAMSFREARDIFFGLAPQITIREKTGWFRSEERTVTNWDAVTPDDVADAIDRYLSRDSAF